MKFGDKVKDLRIQKGWSQSELARRLGVTQRTIAAYETGNAYPRRRDTYDKIAAILETQVNYLRTEDEEFMTEVSSNHGARGVAQLTAIKKQVAALFAGGEISEDDEMAFMKDLNDMFFDAKRRAKKYTNKRYQKEERKE